MRMTDKLLVPGALILGLGLALIGTSQSTSARGQIMGKEVWSVGVPCEYAMALVQGVSSREGVLSEEGCAAVALKGDKYLPDLVSRRADDGRVVFHAVIRAWPNFLKAHKGQFFPGFDTTRWFNASLDPSFQFLRQSDAVLMIDSPWLAVVDLRSGSIIRSLLPSPDLTDPKSPALHDPIADPLPMVVAVSSGRGAVAVASNIGKGPRVSVFNSELTKRIKTWTFSRYIKDIAWSRDGKHLAVLYDGKFDGKGKYVGQFPQWMPVRLPDVTIFDTTTGAKLVSFFTGGPEAEIAFSPNGTLVYTISETSNVTTLQKYAVRAFSSTSGKLVRVISPRGPHVHDEFAISPDGRFIAANASTPLWHPFFTEAVPFGNVTRLVVLDAKTGKILFSHSKRIGAAVPLNPIFTPDGQSLIVQYGPVRSAKGKQRELVQLVAYSMAGS